MGTQSFKAQAYIKDGCPFSFKYLLFMAEAGLLDRIEIIRLNPESPDFERVKAKLTAGLGKDATFPTVEVEPDRYMADSDRLIEHFAASSGARPESMPVLAFYKETIFPQLGELHRLKSAQKRS